MKIGRKAAILNNLRHVTSDTTPNFVSLTLRPMFIVENLRRVTNSPILVQSCLSSILGKSAVQILHMVRTLVSRRVFLCRPFRKRMLPGSILPAHTRFG